MLLWWKLTSEICQESKEFRWKKWLKIGAIFHFFSLKMAIFQEKRENVILFSNIKIKIPTNFMHLRLKVTSEIRQKMASLDVKTALNGHIFYIWWFYFQKQVQFRANVPSKVWNINIHSRLNDFSRILTCIIK